MVLFWRINMNFGREAFTLHPPQAGCFGENDMIAMFLFGVMVAGVGLFLFLQAAYEKRKKAIRREKCRKTLIKKFKTSTRV